MAPKNKKSKVSSEAPVKEVIELDDNSVDENIKALEPAEPPTYIIEIAKSGRAECQKCNSKIAKNEIRCGIITEGEWGLFTKWQHLTCTVFHRSIESPGLLDGFHELDADAKATVGVRVQQSKKLIDSDYIPVAPDELVRHDWTEEMEAPPELLMPLLPYQREGLSWMVHQEHSSMAGGILADEMGMGKTIQAISLMLKNRSPKAKSISKETAKSWSDAEKRHALQGADSAKLTRGGTLIVLPTIAIRQWQAEIFRFTQEGSLTIKVYHGSDRADSTLKELVDADIVITSYKILEIEYRKATAGCKVDCRLCGKKFYPEKLRVHRKFFCGETAQRSDAQAKTQKKGSSKASRGRGGGKAQSEDDDEDDDEDEEEVEKEEVKEVVKVAAKKSVANSARGRRASAKPVVYTIDSDDDADNATDDDFIPVGKRKRSSHSTASASAPVSVSGKSKSSTGRSGKGGTKHVALDSGSDSSFSADEDDESDDDEDDESEEEVISKKRPQKGSHQAADQKAAPSKKHQMSSNSKKKQFPDEKSGKSWKAKASNNDDDDSEVERDIAKALKKLGKQQATESVLHSISWFRIILDEAHLIKDRSTSTAKSVFNLVSLCKWCLTGTPLQNRVGELYSLIRFLRIDPHAFYYCKSKDCTCKSLHYRFTKGRCDDCNHSAMQHFCHFNKHILNPIKRSGYVGEGRRAMLKLKEQVLDEVLLRRTKLSRADDIELPIRVVKVRQEAMDEREDDFYQALYTQSQAQFNTYVASGTVLNNYAHIFDILIRLRQAVDHPYLVIHSNTKSYEAPAPTEAAVKSKKRGGKGSAEDDDLECGICHEPLDELDAVQATCRHKFCKGCIEEYVATVGDRPESEGTLSARCPTCNKPLTVSLLADNNLSVWDSSIKRRKSILDKVVLSQFQSSTKLEALMQELIKMTRNDLGAKAIVFSQFVNMLDLVEYRIQTGGITCVKLQGSMDIDQRDKVLKAFNEDRNVKVLLISLKAGGVALNLTVANYIFLMDPWWNPAAEMQAIDRTHRLGQHKPIFATRFIIQNTIEERIIKLQEKKKLVFDGTVGGDACSMAKLTVDDMRFLFQ